MKLTVNIAEFQNSVNSLSKALSEFESSTGATRTAGDTVLAGWAGEARDKFDAQHQRALGWFGEMNGIVQTYIAAANAYLSSVSETDAASASSISNK